MLVGRPVLHALAVGGPVGVAHLLKILLTELEAAMALTGCRNLAAIGPEVARFVDGFQAVRAVASAVRHAWVTTSSSARTT